MLNKILAVAIAFCLLLPLNSWGQQEEMIAGAAASTEITELFFEHFQQSAACADYNFKVMATPIRHKSGVLTTNRFIFGRTGYPLTEQERNMGKEQILLGKIGLQIAVGLETNVAQIKLQQLEQVFTRKITNWKELGGNDAQIMLIGKEQADPSFTSLQKEYPFFALAQFDKIIKYDNETSKFLRTPQGAHSIAFGAKPNFNHYNHITVDGFSAAIPVGLAYDAKNEQLPVVKAAKDYAASADWKKLVKTIDALPIE